MGSVATAASFAEREAQRAGWSEPALSRLVLAVTEATSNAVEHGAGDLYVSCACTAGRCDVVVADDGAGPSRSDVSRADVLPPTQSLHGRGLYILRQLSDTLHFDGSTLSITVVRAPGP